MKTIKKKSYKTDTINIKNVIIIMRIMVSKYNFYYQLNKSYYNIKRNINLEH